MTLKRSWTLWYRTLKDMQPAESVEEDCGCEAVTEEEGHPKELLMKVVQQMQDDAAMGDYTAIDDLLKDIPEQTLRGFLSQVEDVQEQEDEEYDPRRVKADVNETSSQHL